MKSLLIKNFVRFQTLLWLTVLIFSAAQPVRAQFEVVYIKGKAYYRPDANNPADTPREVRVGDKLRRDTPLEFRDEKAYVALYNPSYGRIVIPDKEEEELPSSSRTEPGTKRGKLKKALEFVHREINGYVILSDSGKIDLTAAFFKTANDLDRIAFIDSLKFLLRYRYLEADSSPVTVEHTLRDFYKDFKLKNTLPEDRDRSILLGKKFVCLDTSGKIIDQRRIIGYIELIARLPDHSEDRLEVTHQREKTDKNVPKPRTPKQLVRTVRLRHPDSTEVLRKEVQVLLNGFMVNGKNFNESVTGILPYIAKYFGEREEKFFRDDVEAWIRQNYTFEIKK